MIISNIFSYFFFLRAIDRRPSIRFDNVVKSHGMETKKSNLESNINRLKNMSVKDFRYMYHSGLEMSPDYPYEFSTFNVYNLHFFLIRFPIIDNDILTNDLEDLILTGPLVNIDILVGVTADEALYFAEEHIFNHYLPRKYRTNPSLTTTEQLSTKRTSKMQNFNQSIENEYSHGFSYFRKNDYVKNYVKINYPNHLCYYGEIQKRYMPIGKHQHILTKTAHLYTNLVR